jgi:hypothetical protein
VFEGIAWCLKRQNTTSGYFLWVGKSLVNTIISIIIIVVTTDTVTNIVRISCGGFV